MGPPEKIVRTLQTFVSGVSPDEFSFEKVGDWIGSLRKEPDWTEAEIAEIRALLIRALFERQR